MAVSKKKKSKKNSNKYFFINTNRLSKLFKLKKVIYGGGHTIKGFGYL